MKNHKRIQDADNNLLPSELVDLGRMPSFGGASDAVKDGKYLSSTQTLDQGHITRQHPETVFVQAVFGTL